MVFYISKKLFIGIKTKVFNTPTNNIVTGIKWFYYSLLPVAFKPLNDNLKYNEINIIYDQQQSNNFLPINTIIYGFKYF